MKVGRATGTTVGKPGGTYTGIATFDAATGVLGLTSIERLLSSWHGSFQVFSDLGDSGAAVFDMREDIMGMIWGRVRQHDRRYLDGRTLDLRGYAVYTPIEAITLWLKSALGPGVTLAPKAVWS